MTGPERSFMQGVNRKRKVKKIMMCIVCDYIYEPQEIYGSSGIRGNDSLPGLARDWQCPECGAGRSCFREVERDDMNVEVCE
jgi:rubredoxin